MSEQRSWPQWFPRRRFDLDFPLVFWFAGLWFYLKSFLYVCYVYMLGTEPGPYDQWMWIEIGYFAAGIVPSLLLGLALWNEKKNLVWLAVAFLLIDTPMLTYHVMRLAKAGFMDSGLTKFLEFGSLGLNFVSLGWLIGYFGAKRTQSSRR